jgi:hypothetical protein
MWLPPPDADVLPLVSCSRVRGCCATAKSKTETRSIEKNELRIGLTELGDFLAFRVAVCYMKSLKILFSQFSFDGNCGSGERK